MKKQSKKRKPYAGRERFGDWDLGNIIPLEPGQILVNDDPEGDPYKFARHGEPDLVRPPAAPQGGVRGAVKDDPGAA
jgi:hypothetical protein